MSCSPTSRVCIPTSATPELSVSAPRTQRPVQRRPITGPRGRVRSASEGSSAPPLLPHRSQRDRLLGPVTSGTEVRSGVTTCRKTGAPAGSRTQAHGSGGCWSIRENTQYTCHGCCHLFGSSQCGPKIERRGRPPTAAGRADGVRAAGRQGVRRPGSTVARRGEAPVGRPLVGRWPATCQGLPYQDRRRALPVCPPPGTAPWRSLRRPDGRTSVLEAGD